MFCRYYFVDSLVDVSVSSFAELNFADFKFSVSSKNIIYLKPRNNFMKTILGVFVYIYKAHFYFMLLT